MLSHADTSSEMKPASPGSSLPPDKALSAEETTAATTLALYGSDACKEAEDSKVDKTSQGKSLPGESSPGESVLEVDRSSGCPGPQSLLHLVSILSDSGQDVHEEVVMASDAALATSAEPDVLSSPPSGGSVSVADVSKENPATLDPPPSSRVSASQEVSEEAEETAGSTSVLGAEDVSGEGPSGDSSPGETGNGRVPPTKAKAGGQSNLKKPPTPTSTYPY